uniref:Cytochrome b-c1 complex subunit 9 n=1 Tax=Lactuca sativa TaxID=4236 RepID=A0A9R1V6M1_LACSA|nr:hypothetical protein LSAT_V11C600313830 [Lactuca sativa]
MSSAARRTGGLFEGLYKVLMRRNSVYVTFVIAGAFVGERVSAPIHSNLIYITHTHTYSSILFSVRLIGSQAVDYGVHKLWENNNVGKRYEDIPVLGQRPTE